MIEISYFWSVVFIIVCVFSGYWIGQVTASSTWVKLAFNNGVAMARVIPEGMKFFRVVEVPNKNSELIVMSKEQLVKNLNKEISRRCEEEAGKGEKK